jgi:hypothetical protein
MTIADVAIQPRRRSTAIFWIAPLLGSALSLLVSYGMVAHSLVLGSRTGRWVYPYIRPFGLRSLAIFLLVSVVAGLLVAAHGRVGRSEWLSVCVWIVAAVGLQQLLRSLTPYTFERIFASDGANAFYGVAQHYTAATVLGDFDRIRVSWPLHAQSNMPGKLMLVYALGHISWRPDVLAWLIVLTSNLGSVLMYVFVRDLFADRQVALYSLILYLFVPAKLYFFPLLNTVTPVVVLCCACLLVRWLKPSSRVARARRSTEGSSTMLTNGS